MVGSTIETSTTYEPYGKLLAQSGSSGTAYGYTGEQHDALTDLVYLRARYYNPALKVLQSKDPFSGWIGLPASQHGFSYTHNNPVNFIDPSGKCYGPVQFLRQLEPMNCANMDMAFEIMSHPNATGSQKAGAFTYATALTFGHLSGAAGVAVFTYALGTGTTIGVGLGMGVDSTMQTINNYLSGMPLGQAIYNVNGAQVIGSGVAGGFTAGVGGTTLSTIAKNMGLAFGSGSMSAIGGTIFTSAFYGSAINVTGGRMGEIVTNALMGCDPFYVKDRGNYVNLAVVGAVTAGLGSGVDQYARSSARAAYQVMRNEVHNEAWDSMLRAGVEFPSGGYPYMNNIEREIGKRAVPIVQRYYATSQAISVAFNSDMWKGILDSTDLIENNNNWKSDR